MKAKYFIEKVGWEVAIDLANRENTSIGYLSVEHHDINQNDLKQYTDAWELVDKVGGLNRAKGICSVDVKTYLGCKLPDCEDLKQAIQLVESIEVKK